MGTGQRDWTIFIGEDVIPHKTDHQAAGLDEIAVTNLSGKTADYQRADNLKAEEAALRPAIPAAGDVFFSTDLKRLSIGYEASPGTWYDFDPVDETDTDTVKNKLVSNNLAKNWETGYSHVSDTPAGATKPHGIDEVDETGAGTTKNKCVSDALAKGWQDTKGAMAAGIIVMWSGTIATIPSGWALCDGTTPTPDLRSKFVYGAAAGIDPGGTGGATTHSHTVDSHLHSVSITTGVPSAYDIACIDIPAIDYALWNHTHLVSGNTGSTAPGTDSQSNLPPYYTVAFIMKT